MRASAYGPPGRPARHLYYAAITAKQLGIFLICREPARLCLQHGLRFEEALAFWRLPVAVWRISPSE